MIYVFDTETRMLADEVEQQYAAELAGESPWSRPDLFGFAAGVIVDLESGEALRYGPEEAGEMIATLETAERTVGYNSLAFDLPVLDGAHHRGTHGLYARHIDLCKAVWTALTDLASEEGITSRLRQGGLDKLARANGLSGKTGVGTDAPALYKEGRIEELLTYCEADVRLTTALYQRASETGVITVEPTYRDSERNRVELGSRSIHVDLDTPAWRLGEPRPLAAYPKTVWGLEFQAKIYRAEDLSGLWDGHERPPAGVLWGGLVAGDLDALFEMAAEEEVGDTRTDALALGECVFPGAGVGLVGGTSRKVEGIEVWHGKPMGDCWWLRRAPSDAPEEVKVLLGSSPAR